MEECVFCKIVAGEIPSTKLYEDNQVMVIRDIRPQAETHVLIIPKRHIKEFYELDGSEPLVSIQKAIKKMIEDKGLMHKGYMIKAYGGGAQEVDHLHFHLLGPVKHP